MQIRTDLPYLFVSSWCTSFIMLPSFLTSSSNPMYANSFHTFLVNLQDEEVCFWVYTQICVCNPLYIAVSCPIPSGLHHNHDLSYLRINGSFSRRIHFWLGTAHFYCPLRRHAFCLYHRSWHPWLSLGVDVWKGIIETRSNSFSLLNLFTSS